jgi:murein DD-endopeptidase MepM/ murein hydrolase activator NlpD
MGRFPVAGLAWWSDDWMNPRFVPFFHLHEGVDIFAEFGTPIRSPDKGVVSRLVQGPIGGTAAWITAEDGTQYYFAHMQGYANGISEGSPVETGTVIGFVGDSGDAKGGLPHLHFEVHRGQALPPKPFVDAWLAQAEQDAPAWVASRMTETVARRQLLRSEHALAGLLALDGTKPSGTPEYSVLLTVLDPIGGSVGLLPDVPMAPQRRAAGSSRLIQELIRLRMDGGLLTSLVTGSLIHTDAG